jgi:hypothetical protein
MKMCCFPEEIDPATAEHNSVKVSCAWCGREKKADGEWSDGGMTEAEVAEENLTHGICPECLASEMWGGKE